MNPLSRRRFLKISAAAATSLGVGGVVFSALSDRHYSRILPPGAEPRVLSKKTLAVLATFCDVVLPPNAREIRVAERIDRELVFHPKRVQKDVKSALLLVEHGGLAHLHATRFTKLERPRQIEYLQNMRMRGTDLERQAYSGLRLLAIFFYYCDDRTWKGIHYDGPLIKIASPPEADSSLRRA